MDDERYVVIPLSIQPDGDDYLIGNAALGDFYQMPSEGRAVLLLLQAGQSVREVKAALAEGGEEMVDVDDFVAMLRDIGFIRSSTETELPDPRVAMADEDRRIRFSVDARIALAIFSWPVLVCYVAILGYAASLAWRDPALWVNRHAFFIERDLALTLICLLILSSLAIALHELGHMLAAARYGIESRLGIGHRLWNIVAEADLTGIWSLPKRQRYLPLIAGMLVDLLVIALATMLIATLRAWGAAGFSVLLLQALVLQIVVTIVWQFNLFLKTDVYYVLSNYLSYPNLDADARLYLRDRMHRVSGGRFGAAAAGAVYRRIGILRMFTALWVVGRIAALAVLLLVVVPTLARYAAKTYQAYRDPSASMYTVYDLGAFVLLSALILAGGLYLWLRRRWPARPA